MGRWQASWARITLWTHGAHVHHVTCAPAACVQVWKEQSLLLCLVEEGLTAFRLPSFRMASRAGRTRGANRFALDLERSIVCVAAKKRLLLFHFDGNDFVELKELGLPDIVMDMAWCGDSVCLAFKRECAPAPTCPFQQAADKCAETFT